MAFNSNNFSVDRGTVNSTSGQICPALHKYVSETDTLDDILVNGYFNDLLLSNVINPINSKLLIVGDTILVKALDTVEIIEVLTINPITTQILTNNNSGPTSLTYDHIFIGDITNQIVDSAVNGDIGLAAGVFNINSNVITSDKLSSSFYSSLTHTTTWSGIWGTSQTGDITYTIIGDMVYLNIPTVVATATTASHIAIDTLLPVGIRPITDNYNIKIIKDSTTIGSGRIDILTTGLINIYASAAGNNFAGSGTGNGFYANTISYKI